MRLQVKPAKRHGDVKTIFDQLIRLEDIRHEKGAVSISVLADGIYRNKSRYRYTFELSEAEIHAILAVNPSAQ